LKHDHKPAPPPPPPCHHKVAELCERCDAWECKGCGKEWLGPAEVAKREAEAVTAEKWRKSMWEQGAIGGGRLGGLRGTLDARPVPMPLSKPDTSGWPPGTVLCKADDFEMRPLPPAPGCLHG
jgi:hypothetical protein